MNSYEQVHVHVCAENSGGHLASNDCKEPPMIRHSDFILILKGKSNVRLRIGEIQCSAKAYDYCISCVVYIF